MLPLVLCQSERFFPLSWLVPKLERVTAVTLGSHVSRLFASGSAFSLYQNSFRLSTWQVVDAQNTFPEANCSDNQRILRGWGWKVPALSWDA